MPRVSIILPNYNNRSFLEERLACIFEQRFSDWELIIIDSYSNDGASEYLQSFTTDPRVVFRQAPKDGIYSNINRGLALARGTLIYIATSDDTMTPDCLSHMISALDRHPECGIAHCNLAIIDQAGNKISGQWESYLSTRFFGERLKNEEVRLAPYDGLLHLVLRTIYTSLTQLLIKREVFEMVGDFSSEWGPSGDFQWEMRASLVTSVVHIPETLATWRVHPKQATRRDTVNSPETCKLFYQMVNGALDRVESQLPNLVSAIRKSRWADYYKNSIFERKVQSITRNPDKLRFLASSALKGEKAAWSYIFDRLHYRGDTSGFALRDAYKIIDQLYNHNDIKELN